MTLTNNYITSRLQGRTGNMMFQLAHGFAKSLEHNRQFVAPFGESSTNHLEKTLFRKLDFNIFKTPSDNLSKHIYGSFHFEELPEPAQDIPTVFIGWYQTEKYFIKYKDVIKDLYSPTTEYMDKVYYDFPFMENKIVAAINVRRGDYLDFPTRHPVVTLDYINEAYKKLPYHDVLLVVSDDIEWCKQNIKLPNVVFNEKYTDCDALWLLSLCDHFVISNSTFSWWGAWLSKTHDKVVISPETWFGPDVTEDPIDIWCENWVKIPTKWVDGFIHLRD